MGQNYKSLSTTSPETQVSVSIAVDGFDGWKTVFLWWFWASGRWQRFIKTHNFQDYHKLSWFSVPTYGHIPAGFSISTYTQKTREELQPPVLQCKPNTSRRPINARPAPPFFFYFPLYRTIEGKPLPQLPFTPSSWWRMKPIHSHHYPRWGHSRKLIGYVQLICLWFNLLKKKIPRTPSSALSSAD